ncbi:PUA-like domain-containing protein [Cristinia sonorae]|uniref:PUA-like domain-containing protein n=1 Tax=Cristinia sonorae TaxID=1940300 RepID=A0A8K0ULB7_9AGAR|nr:PUA-like domain-containing protein [Cristinia sonorae]
MEDERPDPRVWGHIPGVPVGTTWASRQECSDSAVHPGIISGIYGPSAHGAYSIVLSGGYEDDVDLGETFTYTGSGGRQKTSREGKAIRMGPQIEDQSFKHHPNQALLMAMKNNRPIRVVRGFKLNSIYAPAEGYRYDGLYRVTEAEKAVGKLGFKMCRFTMVREPNQSPLPVRYYEQTLAKIKKNSRKSDTKRASPTRSKTKPIVFVKDERKPVPQKPIVPAKDERKFPTTVMASGPSRPTQPRTSVPPPSPQTSPGRSELVTRSPRSRPRTSLPYPHPQPRQATEVPRRSDIPSAEAFPELPNFEGEYLNI